MQAATSDAQRQKNRILTIFKDQFIQFLDELIAQFPQETDLVIIRIFMKDQIPIEQVMTYCIHELLPFSNKIDAKDESFFLQNETLFNGLSGAKVIHFKRLWQSDRLDSEDREAIWEWFSSFTQLAKKYSDVLSKGVVKEV